MKKHVEASNNELSNRGEILLVDDTVISLKMMIDILSNAGYKVRPMEDPIMALEAAFAQPPDLILLDVRMPKMSGFEVCRHLKEEKKTRDVPIIFVSALEDVEDRVKGFEVGGVDFISKPIQEAEVMARVRTHMDLHNIQLNLEKMVAQRTTEVLEREQRFRATFEQAAVGIAHVAPEGRFLRINEKFCEIVGYTHHQLLVRMFQDITHPDDLDADEEHVALLLKGETDIYSTEKRYVTHKGKVVWANLTVSLVRDENENPDYFVAVVEDITVRKNADLKIIEYKDRLKDLTKELTIAEEKVRRQIAMDLHDNVGQMLASAHMQLSQVSQTDDLDKLSSNVEFISTTLSDAIQATREAIINLSPPQLNELGLSAAVHDYMKEQIEAKHNIITKFNGEEVEGVFDENTRLLLFRSIRELMINVVKHAQAKHLDVDFKSSNGNLEITVNDDGMGFLYNPDLLRLKSNRYGLFSIQERIADLGGTMEVNSEFEVGTTIKLIVPLN